MTEKVPKREHKNLAILFTDIVKSTEYFRRFGDEKGREMLRLHFENCKPEIERFGGNLLKTVGDSIMAYFQDPEDALMAAISIQNRFEAIRKNTKEEDWIHLRIGIHYGKVIYEKEDIFGDTVNLASRLTDLSDIDGILISETVKNSVSEIDGITFTEREHGLPQRAYSVSWEKERAFEPKKCIAVKVELLTPNLGKSHDEATIKRLLLNPNIQKVETDGSFTIILPKTNTRILSLLPELKVSLLDSILKGELWAYKVVVDLFSSSSSSIPFSEIEPMGIYVSEEAKKILDEELSESGRSISFGKRKFFELNVPPDEIPEEIIIKLKLNVSSICGNLCFYCGDQRHVSRDCPSKKIWDFNGKEERLKNLDSKRLYSLLLHYLLGSAEMEDRGERIWPDVDDPDALLRIAVFNIKRVFQLRFLKDVLGFRGDSWEDLIRKVSQEEGGGFLYLALDSLRVSDYRSFRRIIDEYEPKKRERFLLLCAKGFYFVEMGDLHMARESFTSALALAANQVERIYALFLCTRVCLLLKDFDEAKRFSKELLQFLKDSKEARYLDLLLSAHDLKEPEKFKRKLISVVSESYEHFFYVLFDPELFAVSPHVHQALKDFSSSVKRELDELTLQLRSTLLSSFNFLLGEEIEELKGRIDELERKRSEGTYFDLLETRGKIKALWERISALVKERMATKSMLLSSLTSRLEKQIRFIESLPYPFLVGKTKKKVSDLIERLKGLKKEETYETVKKMAKELDEESSKIDRELEGALRIAYLLKGASSFLKTFFIFAIPLLLSEHLFRHLFLESEMGFYPYEPKSFRLVVFAISIIASFSFSIRSLRKLRI